MLNLEPINELHRHIQAVLKRDNMIKPNELRIGNLVGHQDSDYTSDESEIHFTGRIESIDERYVIVSELGLRGTVNYEDLIPIHLTPEILEKCGFEKRLDYWEPFVGNAKGAWYKRGDMFIVVLKSSGKVYRAVPTNGDEFGFTDGPEITSLHQLQNLIFALTGDELEVKL